MIQAILGKKVDQSQKFLEDGSRIPVTRIWAGENYVVQAMPNRVQLGFDTKKHITKPIAGILKKAGIEKNLRFFHEVAAENGEIAPGTKVTVVEVLKPGDLVQVMGISKGKGFQGGVKLHHFKGGPRTHGQSDRERAPGSIGQTTTPGRVYKGKRMAARMGTDRVTIKKVKVMDVAGDVVTIMGLVPGGRNSLLVITKIGEDKKFVPLYREVAEETKGPEETKVEEAKKQEKRKAAATNDADKSVESKQDVQAEKSAQAEKAQEVKEPEEVKDAS